MLTLWRPFNDLATWGRAFDNSLRPVSSTRSQFFSPEVDIEELEDRYVLRADLPGMEEQDIDVQVHEGTLHLSGKREESVEQESEGGFYRERRYGSFARRFRLGSHVDAEKIEATYDKGVLSVVLPKKEEAKPRQIPVGTN